MNSPLLRLAESISFTLSVPIAEAFRTTTPEERRLRTIPEVVLLALYCPHTRERYVCVLHERDASTRDIFFATHEGDIDRFITDAFNRIRRGIATPTALLSANEAKAVIAGGCVGLDVQHGAGTTRVFFTIILATKTFSAARTPQEEPALAGWLEAIIHRHHVSLPPAHSH